jgi:hypothetical protein
MEFDWYCAGWLVWSNQADGGFFGLKKAMSEPAGKEGNLMPITNTWANRVTIVNSVITRYLTLTKVGWSTFAFQSCSWIVDHYLLPVCYSLFICCSLLSCLLLRIHIWSLCSVISNSLLFSVCSVRLIIQCLITQCYFCSGTRNVFQVFWSP